MKECPYLRRFHNTQVPKYHFGNHMGFLLFLTTWFFKNLSVPLRQSAEIEQTNVKQLNLKMFVIF